MLWPALVYAAVTVALTAAILGASYFLGQRHQEPGTGTPYESGIVSSGSAHVRLPVRYYLVAMFFIVFDLEAAFVFVWAVAARDLGAAGYWAILIFIAVLLAALLYLWGIGALDWSGELRAKAERDAVVSD